MQTLPADLPTARRHIENLQHDLKRERTQNQTLQRENVYLKEQLRLTRSRHFGRSSEKCSPEESPSQVLLFPVESVAEQTPVTKQVTYTRHTKRRIEGKLPEGTRFPEELPREETIIDEGEGEVVLEKVTERLAARPSSFYVKRIVRRVRKVDGSLVTPELPPTVIEGTTTDVSFLVYVIVAKYIWHLPLYRQEQILKSQGIRLSRDTLVRYVLATASLLKPIYAALGVELFSSDHLFADETPVMVGSSKKGAGKRFKEAWFWTFLGASGCAFYHAPTRAYKEVEPLLKSFSGELQIDGYSVYGKISREYPEITLVGCWAHARRKFVDAEKGGNAPESTEALRYIRALYRVETWIRDKELAPPRALRLRQRFSRQILKLFQQWLKTTASNPTLLPRSLFGAAVGYTLDRWAALIRYTDDPKLAIDSNAVEREIRPVALGKKNWLFCASEAGAEASAILYSLIASCRLADVDPTKYLTDVLERISTHPAADVAQLIPVNWRRLVEAEQSAPSENV